MLTAALKLRKGDDIHAIQVHIRSFLADDWTNNRLSLPEPNSGVFRWYYLPYFVFLVLRKNMAIAVVTIPITKAPMAPCLA